MGASKSGESKEGRQPRKRVSRASALRRLTLNEWLTLLVSLCTLAVSVLAWRTAADTSDLKQAVDGLTNLAGETAALVKETKRGADASAGQLNVLNSQVAEVREQTKAISAQAAATDRSAGAAVRAAEASIRAAEAQRRMADTTERTQRPQVVLGSLEVGGFAASPDDSGLIPITIKWRFNNAGGGSFKSKNVEWGLIIANELPPAIPAGIKTPGFDYVIVNSLTSGLRLREPVTLKIDGSTRDAVSQGSKRVFFFARVDFEDGVTGEPRTKCFGAQVLLQNGSSVGHRPAGGAAYHCDGPRR